MLFTFPSRYWFTIGLSRVFSLAGWSRRIHTGLLVPRATQDTARPPDIFAHRPVTVCGGPFQGLALNVRTATTRSYNPAEAGTPAVWALPRSLATTGGIIDLFSLPAGTKMFQFPAFASAIRRMTVLLTAGLSHSETRGSTAICASPRLIAACHVLPRL